jgi:hypothetical protein
MSNTEIKLLNQLTLSSKRRNKNLKKKNFCAKFKNEIPIQKRKEILWRFCESEIENHDDLK